MKLNRFWNSLFKKSGVGLLALALAVTCFGCTRVQTPPKVDEPPQEEVPPAWASNYDLPDADSALAALDEIYGGQEKVFLLLNGMIARMPCPHDEVIIVNVVLDVGEYAKLVLEDSIAEFNEVFAVINPHYQFAINYAPTEDDLAQKYSIPLTASDDLATTETSQVFGVAHVGYFNGYSELGDFGITIRTEVFHNGSYLMTTFKHELMHLLGAGDAYKNAEATKATVMQSYTVNGYHHLSETDVAFLDALYRNPALSDEDGIGAYITSYEESTLHTRANVTAAVYHRLVANLTPQKVLNEANAIGYSDLTEFSATIADGIRPDPTFGSQNISFKEIEYAEPQSETYFGSIDPENHSYWHGRQTTIGSSQGIGYTDYGNGILYAAPNGNLYTVMIQVGEFVLAFRLGGSFMNFADLSLTLWHISK